MNWYIFARSAVRFFYRTVFRLQAHGLEHIPENGPVIVCCNHISNWDPTTLGVRMDRPIHYMAKEELFKIPVLASLIRSLGAFPVKRGGVSKEAIRTALKLLADSQVMGIFPEGSRSGGMGKKGAASLALKSGATVIPAAIVGKYALFRKLTIVYGEPVDLSEFHDGTSESLEAATSKIMQHIQFLKGQVSK